MKRLLLLLSAAVLGLFIAGCNSSMEPSGISVAVDCIGAGADGADATLTLRYTNESVYALGVSKSSHRLYLNGTAVARIDDAPAVGIPPMKFTAQPVGIHFENAGFVRQLAASGAPVRYRLESTLFETVGEEDYKVKLHADGSLDLSPLAAR